MTQQQQVTFIRQQYQILSTINKIVDGTAQLRGVSYFTNQRSNKNE